MGSHFEYLILFERGRPFVFIAALGKLLLKTHKTSNSSWIQKAYRAIWKEQADVLSLGRSDDV